MIEPLPFSLNRNCLRTVVLLVICTGLSLCPPLTVHALDPRLARFLPVSGPATPTPSLAIPSLPAFAPKAASIDDHNRGVDLNNQGLQHLRNNDTAQAIRLLYQAVECDPAEKGFWNNLLVALKRDPQRGQEALDVAYKLIALDSSSAQGYNAAGMVLQHQLKQPRDALPFLARAHELSPDDVNCAVALASCYERTGYPDQALELLKQFAHRVTDDAYPHYLLGLLLLARDEFPAAVRALTAAAERDQEGYAHEALIRARYLGGQLTDLGQTARNTLARFPQILNRDSLERLSFSLSQHTVRFYETIRIDLSDVQTIRNVNVRVRPIPDVPGHQQVKLESAEWISRNRRIPTNGSTADADGRSTFALPEDAIAPSVFLRLGYSIKLTPWLVSRGVFQKERQPDLEALQSMPGLSLDDPLLEELHQALKKLPGNGLQNLYLAVSRGLSYKENFEDHPVSWALQNPHLCDCTEYSYLLTALCLKRGIPARVVTGFLIKPELLNQETNVGHAWVETWFAEKGWVPLDPTLAGNMRWAYFGNLLSDQILFERTTTEAKARVSVDVTSTRNDMSLKISSSFLCSLIN